MGIFTSTSGICDKCGELVTFDGPFSSCGCYSLIVNKIPPKELDKDLINESKRITKNIKYELSRIILARNLKDHE